MRLRSLGFCVFLLSVSGLAQEKPRVFITDSKSWEISGGGGGSGGTWASHTSGGARPQTAEIIKTFGEKCPHVTINNKSERADYVVLLDHEGGKGWIRKDNKVAVFNGEGDSIVSKSTRSLGGSVETACEAISKDWTNGGAERAAARQAAGQVQSSPRSPDPTANTSLHVTSDPGGADIELDGNFVGNAPSTIQLSPGDHTLTVKKAGYKSWERKIRAAGGDINVKAELEKTP